MDPKVTAGENGLDDPSGARTDAEQVGPEDSDPAVIGGVPPRAAF